MLSFTHLEHSATIQQLWPRVGDTCNVFKEESLTFSRAGDNLTRVPQKHTHKLWKPALKVLRAVATFRLDQSYSDTGNW